MHIQHPDDTTTITMDSPLYQRLYDDLLRSDQLDDTCLRLLFSKMKLEGEDRRRFMTEFLLRFASTDLLDDEFVLPHIRFCSHCRRPMDEGYCIDNGLEYYCSDQCLTQHMTMKEFEELYDEGRGDSYWTDWKEV